MDVIIPENIVKATRMSPEALLRDIAVLLFQQKKLTLGQASLLAGMKQPDFQQLLARCKIPLHYDVEDFRKDLKTLEELGIR
ncbi:MAG: UPF0175 family protein [Candidatus Binatia bacterium]